MKKFLLLIIVSFFCFVSVIHASAIEHVEEDLSEKLFSGLDSDITEILDDFGISSLDYNQIYNISLSSIFTYYKEDFTDCLHNYLNLFSKILSVLILAGAVCIITDEKRYKSMIAVIFVPIITVILVGDINSCLSSAVSLLKLNGTFMLVFVPVYAVAIAIAGNPATALTYNTIILTFAEFISAVINYGLVEIIGCFFCLCIAFSVNSTVNYPRFLSTANRLVSFILGLGSSLFTSLLTVKGIFSASTDSVATKGIRFAIGSLIPVIGSSISDAYSSLIGSIGILKNSVAIIGIIVIVIINLPVIAEIVMFNITLNILSFISELFDCYELSNALKGFACGIKIIGLLVVFEAFILIISTAVMLTLRGG